MSKSVLFTTTVCLIVAVGSILVWAFSWPQQTPQLPHIATDPSIAATETAGVSDAHSHDADAGFVGHMKCAECHADIHGSHMFSPHSRTFSSATQASVAQSFRDSKHFAGEKYGTYDYKVDDSGLAVALKDRFPDKFFPLQFAIGSGKHGVTFLTLQEDGHETVAVEHRISWFSHVQQAGLTPGQEDLEPDVEMSFFGKVVRGNAMRRCVSCHVTTGEIIGGEIHDLTAGIHCERCHGPGAAHVDLAESGDSDAATSAIRNRWTGREEVALCGDCHRMPRDVSTETLQAYPDSLVRFQPIGLLKSRCFLSSGGRLRCTTCHDAHTGVDSRSDEIQTGTCRSCHGESDQIQCAAKETTDCINCHMPPVELVPGVSFHDHWIRVRTR